MDGNKRKFFHKHQSNQFKRKVVSKKGRWNNSSSDQSSGSSPADTVYRILCPSRKIGGVIGKGGDIVKALREETHAKIRVADSVPGSDERVIIIYSSSEKISRKQDSDEDSDTDNEGDRMEPHCAAQDALLKVHERIIEEDLFGGMAPDEDNENNVVTARLLVPNNMVGCVLGKGGDVIQRLRSETGASIRVLPADHLPICAMSGDELVQISGKTDVAKRALYEVSTLLHQNPRKDKYPNVPMPYGGHNLHPSGPMTNTLPPGNRMWSHRDSATHSMPPMPWMGGYGNQPSGYGPGGFNGVPPGHGGEPQVEFSMKILCYTSKIGGVIGKGGSNIRVVEQDTGASIKVEDTSADSDERAIRVSAFETLWNPRSQTIEAILQLQNKTSEFSEKGAIITRLLVPSSKVGCILGQGGQVINEMRRRTQADIRVYSKDEKPKCASEDEELVQISGNFGVAKDALAEIASRIRVRTLRDANVGAESGHVGSVRGFGPARPGRGPLPSSMIGGSISSRCEPLMGGGHEYEPQTYPVPASATGYSNASNLWESNISNNGVNYVMGAGGSNISNIGEGVGTRVKLRDSQPGGSESVVAVRGTSENLTAPQGFPQLWSSVGQNMNAHQVSHQNNMADKPSSYQNMSAQQSTYQNMNVQQSPYQNVNLQQSPYQNLNLQQSPYSVTAQQVAYTNAGDPHGVYHNISAQQGAYQY